MSAMKLVIIGAGPGGYSAAIRAAQYGAQVTLIEKGKPGGTCLNVGCIPSKVMRGSADVARAVKNAHLFGVESIPVPTIDMLALRKRQKGIIDNLGIGLLKHFKTLGINFVSGKAWIEKEGVVKVSNADGSQSEFLYDNLLIACGSKPAAIPGVPIDGDKIISSDHALWLDSLPKSLLVIGGGVIGCELAQMYHDLGCQVALVEAMPTVLPLPSLDQEVTKTFIRALKKIKLPIYTGKTVAAVTDTPLGLNITIQPFSGEGEAKELMFEKVLVAIGRSSIAKELGLENVGVKLDNKSWVIADEHFKTNVKDIWAIGDCLGPTKIMLAHVATAEALAAVENMFGKNETVTYETVPSAIFTVPEIASVGLTFEQAQEKDRSSTAHNFLFRQLGKAQAMGEIDGFIRLISGTGGVVLGGHIIGPCATSLIAEIGLAVTTRLTVSQIAKTIHAHPTLPEGTWEAALAAAGTPLHSA